MSEQGEYAAKVTEKLLELYRGGDQISYETAAAFIDPLTSPPSTFRDVTKVNMWQLWNSLVALVYLCEIPRSSLKDSIEYLFKNSKGLVRKTKVLRQFSLKQNPKLPGNVFENVMLLLSGSYLTELIEFWKQDARNHH